MTRMNSRPFASALVAASVAMPSTSIAQVAASNTRFAEMRPNFSDNSQLTTQNFARDNSISIAEASRRLAMDSQIGFIAYEIQRLFPNEFGSVKINAKTGRATLYLSTSATPELLQTIKRHVGKMEGGYYVDFASSRLGYIDLIKEAKALFSNLTAVSIDTIIETDATQAAHTVATKDPSAILRLLFSKQLSFEPGTRVAYSGGVTLVAKEAWGGFAFNSNGNSSCTLGFNVGTRSGGRYGQSTSGHCPNSGSNGQYNVRLGFQQEWNNNDLDIQWHTFLGGNDWVVVGKSNQGQGLNTPLVVRGAQYATPGSYVCKYGITTRYTCGYIDTVMTTDSWGTFPRILANSQYPDQAIEGDSGGPVFGGDNAVGNTHARPNNPPYHNIFAPVSYWYDKNLPIGIIACC